MFSNFEEETRNIIVNAKIEMKKLKHPYVGSEHLLLAILKDNNNVSKKLKEYNLTYDKFKQELIDVVGIGKIESNLFLYTPLLKRVLETASINGKEDGNCVTIEHLFSAILEEGEGIAIRILLGMRIDLEELDRQIHGREEIIPIAYVEGSDLTEILNIEKYEPPVSNGPLGDLIHHEWYIPKTDEERIQVCAEDVLPIYLQNPHWYATIKLDGCSCTAGLFDDAFLIGGRNQFYKDENMYTTTVKKYISEEKLKEYRDRTGVYVALQGELCGPGIQSNRLGLAEKDWFIFNVFISTTGER